MERNLELGQSELQMPMWLDAFCSINLGIAVSAFPFPPISSR